MANTQTKTGFWRSVYGWMALHKVKAALCLVVLAGLLYLGGSWTILQVQIHAERERFVAVQQDMAGIAVAVTRLRSGQASIEKYCFYSSSTNEFYRGDRYCTVRVVMTTSAQTKSSGLDVADHITSILRNDKLGLINGSPGNYSLVSADFQDRKFGCTYNVEYYDATVPSYERTEKALKTGNALMVDILCSGLSKADYFPVTQD